jgi:CxxC-x17-CxxC domain-containing protein
MKNFKHGGSGGGFKKFGGKKFGDNKGFGGNNTGGRPFLYQATCSKCGKDCMLPFKPNGSKPVFCSNCFALQKEGSDQNRSGGHNYTKATFGDKPMFQTICAKCGDRCEVPFRPVNGKPAYCKNCFDKGSTMGSGTRSSDQSQSQFDALNAKLDKILKLLSPTTVAIGAKKEKNEEDKPKEVVLEEDKKKTKTAKAKTTSKKVSSTKKKK